MGSTTTTYKNGERYFEIPETATDNTVDFIHWLACTLKEGKDEFE